ncbi:MAG: class I SAM-dependent methyltransferase, partial [bacterium]|nr:class I SAM-dependent methyltransferase [bacterium]
DVLQYANSLAYPKRRAKALDFGCGVGRLTQALVEHFDEVHGLDVSKGMVRQAREFNRHGDRCVYTQNEQPHLGCYPDARFDFIYSNITLQHMAPRLALGYLREFLRVLAPGGLLVFQLPTRRLRPLRARLLGNVYQHFVRIIWPIVWPGRPLVEMYGISRKKVVSTLSQSGGKVLDVRTVNSAGSDWETLRYAVTAR